MANSWRFEKWPEINFLAFLSEYFFEYSPGYFKTTPSASFSFFTLNLYSVVHVAFLSQVSREQVFHFQRYQCTSSLNPIEFHSLNFYVISFFLKPSKKSNVLIRVFGAIATYLFFFSKWLPIMECFSHLEHVYGLEKKATSHFWGTFQPIKYAILNNNKIKQNVKKQDLTCYLEEKEGVYGKFLEVRKVTRNQFFGIFK